jgi:hypothetical protein
MAGSPKKGSSKGPKSPKKLKTPKTPKTTRRGKAADAPETESEAATKSLELTKDTAAAVPGTGFNDEDCNIRSPERTKLLTQIQGVIRNTPVSPAFWACCQLADMNCLRLMTNSSKAMIQLIVKPLCTLPMQCELLRF